MAAEQDKNSAEETAELEPLVAAVPPKMQSPEARAQAQAQKRALQLCTSVDQLYLPPAREQIAQNLDHFLIANRLSVTELLHNADWIAQLESGNMAVMGVIQRVAMAHAPAGEAQNWIKQLDQLAKDLITQVRADARNKQFPTIYPDKIAGLLEQLQGRARAPYLLRGALAVALRASKDVNQKIVTLLGFVESVPRTAKGWQMLHDAADDIISELIRRSEMLKPLIAPDEDFGNTLLATVKLFLSYPVNCPYGRGAAPDLLAWHFANEDLPASHSALGMRICDDVGGEPALCDGPPRRQMLYFHQLHRQIQRCIGPYMPEKRIKARLNARSARLGHPDVVRACLSHALKPDQKVTELFFIESCLCDPKSRYRTADQIFRVITADSFHTCFQNAQIPLTKRLQQLAQFSRSALDSQFDADQIAKMTEIFDREACHLAERSHLFAALDKRSDNNGQKLAFLCQQHAAGLFTDGQMSRDMRRQILIYLSRPGFMDQFRQHLQGAAPEPPTAEAAWAELSKLLRQVGLVPDMIKFRL